jgi:hypothetical protein
MGGEEIKSDCELQYGIIAQAEERLRELRSICKHEETFEGNYSWRVGCVDRAIICSHCGAVVAPVKYPQIIKHNS